MRARIHLAMLLVALTIGVALAESIERLKNFNELYDAAKRLESNHLQVTESRQTYADKRTRLVYAFVRESKSAQCESHFNQLKKVVEEFRVKAYNYVTESKKPGNWLSGLKNMLAGPLGGMKNLGKFDKNLASIAERYEAQSSAGTLTQADVDCDMAKTLVRNLDAIMFVLQADVKYLVVEKPQVNTIAIYRQLAENKFIANSNFYDYDTPTSRQRELLLDFYAARVDADHVTIGEALDHFHNPGNLVIGRLLDSCYKIADYQALWRELEPNRAQVCANSKSDPANDKFASQFELRQYATTIDFCNKFLDSL